jgi:predicted HicB family RNase H-like nuclease
MMEYKGYTGEITSVDEKQGLIHGHVIGVSDVITFEGKTTSELAEAFRESVDDYLEFCAEDSVEPEKPCSGRFLVRVSPSLHRRAALAARKSRTSLNSWARFPPV